MTVVTFVDYQPLPRHDGRPWVKVNIYESAVREGPWTKIDEIPFVPIDADPAEPMIRSFTTELSTFDQGEGWYKLTFEDATGDLSETDPVRDSGEATISFLPLVSDVGALLRARTKDSLGVELGTFTPNTRPTNDEVLRIIDLAGQDVAALVDTDISPECYRMASGCICLKAAMMVELSYFPEQVATGRSPYDQYKEMYDEMLERLQICVTREAAEEITGEQPSMGNVPQWGFPDAEPLWPKVM